jgi:HK97 family phage major capsid protein
MSFKAQIERAKEKRVKLHQDMSGLVAKAQEEKRDLSGEESAQFDKMGKAFDAASEELRRYEEVEKREGLLAASSGPVGGVTIPPVGGGENRDVPKNGTGEYRQVFDAFLRRGVADTRSLVEGTDSKGGYLVPVDFERALLKRLEMMNVMRQICDVRSLGTLETKIPVVSSQGTAAWIDEEGAYGVTDDAYGQKVMTAKKVGRIIKVSEELLADSAFNLEAEITMSLGDSIAKAEEQAFIAGTDVSDPRGFLTDAAALTTAAVGAVGYQDILNLKFGVPAPYRTNAVWLMSDTAAKAISSLVDTTGRPLWQPSVQAGQPDLLLGKPIYYSPYMPEFAQDNAAIAFGDFKFYRIGDRVGLSIQRLNELYAANGQVGFRAMRRTDGRLLIGEAVAALTVKKASA